MGFDWYRGTCSRNCNLPLYPQGRSIVRGDSEGCECPEGYIWLSSNCVQVNPVNCMAIPGALGSDLTNTSACLCQQGFNWDGSSCIRNIAVFPGITSPFINCSAIPFAFSDVRLGLMSCACQDGFYWNLTVCFRNCSQIDYSSSISANVTECNCISGYNWDGTSCVSLRPIFVPPPPPPPVRPQFFDCRFKRNTVGYGLQPNTCQCARMFEWDSE